jgi:hypothetical protein
MSSRPSLNHAYEVVLAPAAIRTIKGLPRQRRRELAAALRVELVNGRNADAAFAFDVARVSATETTPNGRIYTATPLSCAGYTAVHRQLSDDELHRLHEEQNHPVAQQGVFVIDIVPAESAFGRPGLRRP